MKQNEQGIRWSAPDAWQQHLRRKEKGLRPENLFKVIGVACGMEGEGRGEEK